MSYVFGDDTGRIMTRERRCERWRRVCEGANVLNLHLHDLRAQDGPRPRRFSNDAEAIQNGRLTTRTRYERGKIPNHLIRDK
jgi:hypothetical protein